MAHFKFCLLKYKLLHGFKKFLSLNKKRQWNVVHACRNIIQLKEETTRNDIKMKKGSLSTAKSTSVCMSGLFYLFKLIFKFNLLYKIEPDHKIKDGIHEIIIKCCVWNMFRNIVQLAGIGTHFFSENCCDLPKWFQSEFIAYCATFPDIKIRYFEFESILAKFISYHEFFLFFAVSWPMTNEIFGKK